MFTAVFVCIIIVWERKIHLLATLLSGECVPDWTENCPRVCHVSTEKCKLILHLAQDQLAWENCPTVRVSTEDKFYSLFKSASVEYTVYRVK